MKSLILTSIVLIFLTGRVAAAQVIAATDSGAAASASAQVAAKLKSGGINAALAEFRRLQETNPHSTPMKLLDSLGHSLIDQNRFKDAIRAFRENIAAYPDSATVYASLGDAYLIDGHRTAARDAYRRATELDSTNSRARQLSDSLNARLRH